MDWRWIAVLLAGYGFLKEIRPSEPFITPFLTGPDKNFTEKQVNQSIYPVSTYSTLVLLAVVFLVTDYLRYKPVVVVQSLSAVAVYCLLAWGQGIPLMQLLEVLYGLMSAADVAYFTYMYAKVERERYGTVSASARVGYLLGRCSSGVLSQVTVSFRLLSYLELQYVSLAASLAATFLALALPTVASSFYFHKQQNDDVEKTPPSPGVEARTPQPYAKRALRVLQLLWADGREAFGQPIVVKWALWWALATAGQLMILSYAQILWQETLKENASDEELWNGAVEAVYTLLGAGAVWLTTRKKDYSSWGDVLLATWSLVCGAITLVAAYSRSMPLHYCLYVVFGASYHAAITVASAEVAKRVREDAHALVFGLNTLGALLVQTLLTLAVAGEGGLELDIRTQYVVYGAYFLSIGALYLVAALFTTIRQFYSRKTTLDTPTQP